LDCFRNWTKSGPRIIKEFNWNIGSTFHFRIHRTQECFELWQPQPKLLRVGVANVQVTERKYIIQPSLGAGVLCNKTKKDFTVIKIRKIIFIQKHLTKFTELSTVQNSIIELNDTHSLMGLILIVHNDNSQEDIPIHSFENKLSQDHYRENFLLLCK